MHKIRSQIKQVQLSPINMDTEEAMKSVPIYGVSVWLNLEKI